MLGGAGCGGVAGMFICCCWFGEEQVDVRAGLVCPGDTFGWCCQVPKLVTVMAVDTTIWSVNGVEAWFWPLLDNDGRCPCPADHSTTSASAGVLAGFCGQP